MKKDNPLPVTLRHIAEAAGVSKAAVGYALQNKPGVGSETRKRILAISTQLGYIPDARLASFMTSVRKTREKGPLPIAWLNTHTLEDAWQKYKFLSPYFEGASERCATFGFRLDPVWVRRPGLTISQLSRSLYQRGVEGVIVSHPARHLRLQWKHLAGVSLEGALLAPALDRVMVDTTFNLLLAWKSLRRLGYRRIGICLAEEVDRFSHHMLRSTVHFLYATTSARDRVQPLLHSHHITEETRADEIMQWVRTECPEVVIGHDSHLVKWIEKAGYQVPQDCGVVHLAIDDDVGDWAGIYCNRRAVGRAAADRVIALVSNRQFGVPPVALSSMIRGRWQMGKTIVSRRPEDSVLAGRKSLT
jgi:LacI family transcriptional regulator